MSAVLAIGTTQGVYILAESPGDWKLLGQGLIGRHIHCLQATADGTLWAGTESTGLYTSKNLEEWHPLVNDLSGKGIHSILFHPKESSVMLCGTAPASLYLSLDRGKNFQELPALRQHPGSQHWGYPEPPYRSRLHRLALHPTDMDVIYAGVLSGGFYLSGDVGQSWQERTKGLGRLVHDLCGHPLLPGRIYACSPVGFYVSENLGEAWVERNHGLAYLHTGVLAVHPDEPNVVFLSSHRSAQGGGTVYRSPNAGQRWEACSGLPFAADIRFGAMVMRGDSLVVGSSQGDIFLSRDLGTTWRKIRAAMPPITCLTLILA